MSIAVLIAVHDGLVVAADSASTLSIAMLPVPGAPGVNVPNIGGVANVYDNANKIFNLIKGEAVGCVIFGTGSIGNASIGTLIKDFRLKLCSKTAKTDLGFDIADYTTEQIAKLLGEFLGAECESKLKQPFEKKNTTIGIFIGGYSTGEGLGGSWGVEIKEGVVQPIKKLIPKEQAGVIWGGMGEVLNRIVLGYSPGLFQVLGQVIQSPRNPQELAMTLTPVLNQKLQIPLVFAPMPIQDAIDLGRFLVHSAIMFSRFMPGPQMVGGPIEVAAITKHEGFKWISRKHYYDDRLNREPIHVIHD